ncbi:MAG: hypothetical protein FWG02_06085 [Holophagaceae bacterium]|nr:hypothetical protein [Holophagaceae bacterium]
MYNCLIALRFFSISALLCGICIAQEPEKCPQSQSDPGQILRQSPQERRGQRGQGSPQDKNQADRGRRPEGNIENYLKYLKEARIEQIKLRLGVSNERATTIATKWAELDIPIRRIHSESMSVWRQMQFIIQEASPENEKSRKIQPLNEQYRSLRKKLDEARHSLYHDLPKMGETPIQQTRIMFLMEEMERKERDGIRAFIEKREKKNPD